MLAKVCQAPVSSLGTEAREGEAKRPCHWHWSDCHSSFITRCTQQKKPVNLHADPLPDVSPSPCCNTPPPAHASTTLRSSRKSSQQQKKPQNQNWQMKVLPVLWSGLCCSPTGTGRVSPRRAGGSTAARGWSGERAPGTYHR